jgi:DNA-binding YbaB/EbfC family protein
MIKQAMELRQKLNKAQKELGKITVEGQSGGGAVVVKANGQQKITDISISPAVINPDKPKDLEKLILKAIEEALKKSQDLAAERMKEVTGGINIPGLT